MSAVTVEVAERVRFEAQLLSDLVDPGAPWRYQHTHRGGAASRASYELAISTPQAPEAMAVLRGYVDLIGLTCDSAWSVSAMPSYRGDTSEQRFATITSGSRELAYVWFETATGLMTTWGLRVPPPCPEPRSALAWLEETDGQDIAVAGEGVASFFEVLPSPPLRTSFARRPRCVFDAGERIGTTRGCGICSRRASLQRVKPPW